MKKLPISVFIITKNEEKRIVPTIEAVKDWVDEVIVIDSGSVDKTVDIVKKLGSKVFYNEWKGYGAQKIFGEKKCKNEWILNVDSDEVVSKELKNEIIQMFAKDKQKEYFGYRIRITNVLSNEQKPRKFAYSFNQTRLYNKKKCGFRDSRVHDTVVVDGVKEYSRAEREVIGQLKGVMAHYFMESYTQLLDKWNKYSQMQAEEAVAKGKKTSVAQILFAPAFAFLKAYILRRYFIYGFDGLIFASLFAFSRYMKYIKIRELSRKLTIDN
jgi:glycosyltransferase involved in cell wall biosynthesis